MRRALRGGARSGDAKRKSTSKTATTPTAPENSGSRDTQPGRRRRSSRSSRSKASGSGIDAGKHSTGDPPQATEAGAAAVPTAAPPAAAPDMAHIGPLGMLDALDVVRYICEEGTLKAKPVAKKFLDKYGGSIDEACKGRLTRRDFETIGPIGSGHFGQVDLVRHRNSKQVFAMKTLKKEKTRFNEQSACVEEERHIMACASSRWITALHYAFQDAQHLYLVMDYHPGGDLFSLLSKMDDIFEEGMARFYLAEVLLALQALHGFGFIHRDLKPDNILLDCTGHVKLADFGSSAAVGPDNKFTGPAVGTPDYLPPEVLDGTNRGFSVYGFEADWWAFGVIAFEMLCGTTPFSEDTIAGTYHRIMQFQDFLEFPSDGNAGKTAVDLIKHLLVPADERYGGPEIRAHPFFQGVDFGAIHQTTAPYIPLIKNMEDLSHFQSNAQAEADSFLSTRKKNRLTLSDLDFLSFGYSRSEGLLETPESKWQADLWAREQELEGVRRQAEAARIANLELEQRLAEASQELQESQAEQGRLHAAMADMEKVQVTQAAQLEQQELGAARYREQAQGTSELAEQLKHAEARLAASELEVARLSKKGKALDDKVAAQQHEATALTKETCRLNIENQSLRQAGDRLTERVKQLVSQLEQALASKETMTQASERLELQIRQSMEKEMSQLQGRLAREQALREQAEANAHNDQEAHITELQGSLQAELKRSEELAAAVADLSRQRASLDAQLDEARHSDSESRRTTREAQADNLKLLAQLEQQEQDTAALVEQNASLEQERDEVQRHVERLARVYNDLTEEHQQKLEAFEANMRQLIGHRTSQAQETSGLRAELERSTGEVQALRVSKGHLQVDVNQLKKQLSEQCRANSKLRHSISRLEALVRQTQAAAEKEAGAVRTKLMAALEKLREDNLKLTTINQQQTKLIELLRNQTKATRAPEKSGRSTHVFKRRHKTSLAEPQGCRSPAAEKRASCSSCRSLRGDLGAARETIEKLQHKLTQHSKHEVGGKKKQGARTTIALITGNLKKTKARGPLAPLNSQDANAPANLASLADLAALCAKPAPAVVAGDANFDEASLHLLELKSTRAAWEQVTLSAARTIRLRGTSTSSKVDFSFDPAASEGGFLSVVAAIPASLRKAVAEDVADRTLTLKHVRKCWPTQELALVAASPVFRDQWVDRLTELIGGSARDKGQPILSTSPVHTFPGHATLGVDSVVPLHDAASFLLATQRGLHLRTEGGELKCISEHVDTQSINLIAPLGMVVFTVGKEKRLAFSTLADVAASAKRPGTLSPRTVPDSEGTYLWAAGAIGGQDYLCVAKKGALLLYRWSASRNKFVLVKGGYGELFQDPCSDLRFVGSLGKFMWAATHFYTLDPRSQDVEQFLRGAGPLLLASVMRADCTPTAFFEYGSEIILCFTTHCQFATADKRLSERAELVWPARGFPSGFALVDHHLVVTMPHRVLAYDLRAEDCEGRPHILKLDSAAFLNQTGSDAFFSSYGPRRSALVRLQIGAGC